MVWFSKLLKCSCQTKFASHHFSEEQATFSPHLTLHLLSTNRRVWYFLNPYKTHKMKLKGSIENLFSHWSSLKHCCGRDLVGLSIKTPASSDNLEYSEGCVLGGPDLMCAIYIILISPLVMEWPHLGKCCKLTQIMIQRMMEFKCQQPPSKPQNDHLNPRKLQWAPAVVWCRRTVGSPQEDDITCWTFGIAEAKPFPQICPFSYNLNKSWLQSRTSPELKLSLNMTASQDKQ